jgi:SAM-dependent methyltransferase
LDVGGATGNLGYALRDLFSKTIVVDIAGACREPAEAKGNEFHRANVDTEGLIGIPDGSVQLVVALDFIEHILDPGGFAKECYRVLGHGGMVLINTPNIQFWRHLHSLVIDGRFPHTSGDPEVYHGGHVAFYNLHDMHDIFGAADFVGHRMHTDGLLMEPPPNLWISVSNVPAMQMAVADLVYSCRKL